MNPQNGSPAPGHPLTGSSSVSNELLSKYYADLVVNNEDELSAITFGSSFGSITDIETGPDGFLYVLSFDNGVIYKISPS